MSASERIRRELKIIHDAIDQATPVRSAIDPDRVLHVELGPSGALSIVNAIERLHRVADDLGRAP